MIERIPLSFLSPLSSLSSSAFLARLPRPPSSPAVLVCRPRLSSSSVVIISFALYRYSSLPSLASIITIPITITILAIVFNIPL